MLQYTPSPSRPHSPPTPDSLRPARCACGKGFSALLIHIVPALIPEAILFARSISADQTAPPKPVVVLFARDKTSSSSFHLSSGTIGPTRVIKEGIRILKF